ncbi:MAG: phosphatidate cytidylyltransferase [Thermodesulfobacteriota bacterium]
MQSEKKRVITGLILIFCLALVIFLAQVWVLFLAALLLSWLCLWEFLSLFWPRKQNLALKALGLAAALPIVLHSPLGWSLAGLLLAVFWILSLAFLFSCSSKAGPAWSEVQLVALGLVYIPLAFQFLPSLKTPELLLVFLTALGSDTGAYYAGTKFGRRKLWPRISPKKSWAGAWGGLFVCLVLTLLLGLSLGSALWYHWLWLGLLLNLAAQFGDFFESGLKRQLQVKDSSNLLPGHGGFLDRFDSVLLVLPMYMLCSHFWEFF